MKIEQDLTIPPLTADEQQAARATTITSAVNAPELSVKEKAGRLLFIGLPETRLTRETRALLEEVQPGGVVLFGRNIESAAQVALLNAQIRDVVGDKGLLIGVDQEGGLVDRFRNICEPMPSAKAVREAGRSEVIHISDNLSPGLCWLRSWTLAARLVVIPWILVAQTSI